MKPKLVLSALCAGMAFLLVSCDKPQPPPPPPPPQQQPQPQAATPPQPQKTVIKGFYIGMPAAEVVASLSQFKIERTGPLITAELPSVDPNKHFKSTSFFFLDSETYGNLTELKIDCYTVDMMFGSGSLNAREFADKLSEAYKLPRLDFRIKPEHEGGEYKCVTQDGIKITVSGDTGHEKELDMSKSADSAIKNGFN